VQGLRPGPPPDARADVHVPGGAIVMASPPGRPTLTGTGPDEICQSTSCHSMAATRSICGDPTNPATKAFAGVA